MDIHLISLVLSVFLVGSLVTINGQLGQDCNCPGSCPDGWTQFRGSCYYLFENVSLDWTEAAHHCLVNEANLVTIESKDEDMFLRTAIKRIYRDIDHNRGQEFWIGATDEVAEAVWVWYTGDRPLTYTDWYPGQPGSDGQDEDCAVIAASTSFIGWHDAPCAASHHPLCEIKIQQSETTQAIFG